MTNQTPTHGPWQGLDFDPTTDLNRTALCPDGWVELYWHAYADLVPDCPPQYESYCRALAAMSGEG